MAESHTGALTFLFTDVEGSTSLWERNPKAMSEALSRHDEILRTAIENHNGQVFKTVGDAFHATFAAAPDALEAALEAQRALVRAEWAETGPLRVRIALHTGAAEERDGDYFGPSLNRVSRLLSAGHGGQVLLSFATRELVREQLPEDTGLRDLGERRLKDLSGPEHVFQLTASDLPSAFPSIKTLDRRRNNLPAQPTALVGRERELDEILAMLRSPFVRLLTLTGPGGTGKSRLGLQAAAELTDEFEDGVFFVALAAIADPALVAPTIVRTLGLTESGNQPPEDLLESYLGDRQTLLVLDNFEQVLESAQLLDALLSAASGLKILATSRTPLRLYGEHEFPVPPLSLPDTESLPPVESLTQYEAVRLFVDRAVAARPGFSLSEENAPAVVEICARLDGLPLAIELAAARIKLLPPQAMVSRLGNRLKLLTGGGRNLPERQRTLRNAIEWSYEMLDEGEKTVFARLAVFSGGSTLEAIEAVCDAEEDLPVDALEGVSSLLDMSLIRQEEVQEGEPRFEMLETIHEFALEKFEECHDAGAIRRAHAEYFLSLAELAEPELWGPEDAAWLDKLEVEHDNLRAALSWAVTHEESELALRLGGALRWFWNMAGYYSEGRRRLETALNTEGPVSAEARAKVLEGVGWLAIQQGDLDRAEATAEEGLELCAEAGLGEVIAADFKDVLGYAARHRGDYERAAELLEQSLELHREAKDKRGVAWSLGNLANLSSELGNYERAKELYEEGLALSRDLGGAELLGAHLISLGYEYLLEGDPERATVLNEEAAELYQKRGRRSQLQAALANLGWSALIRGDHYRSEELFVESLVLCRELGDKLIGSESIEGLACAAEIRGEDRRAARLFGASQALHEATGYQQAPRDRSLREPYLESARSRVDERAWAEEREVGRSMTFESAISYALEKGTNH
ncbi:MAG TPA: tetratricopeptide repeat protein [Rubrobacter sp.]|nr:tetratricopeptide repeat protein [Rubrobacter sp.]